MYLPAHLTAADLRDALQAVQARPAPEPGTFARRQRPRVHDHRDGTGQFARSPAAIAARQRRDKAIAEHRARLREAGDRLGLGSTDELAAERIHLLMEG